MLSAKNVRRSKSLHEQTYQALRDSILSGELVPGDRLVEVQIAEQLQVSRTPIREAIRQLQQEELVTTDATGWLRVATISDVEAKHLYDCRIALETLAVSGACDHASDAQVTHLETLVQQAEESLKQPHAPIKSAELLELDYEFHRAIANSSGNTCLTSLLDQVFGKMALLRAQTTRHNPRVLEIRSEHRRIFEAIAQRDRVAATAAIQAHLVSSKARVVQELEALKALEADPQH